MALDGVTPSNGAPPPCLADDLNRPPRLPRWTRQEILVLIQGKKVAENRVRRGRNNSSVAFGSTNLEPKWASVSSYCKKHGVNRAPVQCRKRWSNLAGDYKKIKEWESQIKEESESFWVMRNDVRREKKLPGFFDREVYDILDGAAEKDIKSASAVDEVVFDSGRSAAVDEGLFSDFEHEEVGGSPEKEEGGGSLGKGAAAECPPVTVAPVEAPVPISERQYQPFDRGYLDQDNEKLPTMNAEKGSTSQEGQKRRRLSEEGSGVTDLQSQLIEVLERNSRILTAQLEAQNINCQLDRDQRKDHAESLVGVMSKLADALGRIADKL